jgi:aminoglycoside phosphotransferase (APT) family kinase protein
MPLSLDIEDRDALCDYLWRTGRVPADVAPQMHVLAGGVSNRTVLVRAPGICWVLKQALAQLRVAVEWHSDPRRIEREAVGLQVLAALTPHGTVPELVFVDAAHHLLAMQAVAEPHRNWKQLLLAGQLDASLVAQWATLLGQIHVASHAQAAQLAVTLDDRRFFESLRLEPYYGYAATQVPAAADALGALIAETRQVRLALVHGDYSPKNVLIHAGRVVLLDHEVIHWGDPAFDVGFALTHLLGKANHLAPQRAAFAAAAQHAWACYAAAVALRFGAALEVRVVRHLAACLLARVDGRSPLEYLAPDARARQRRAALQLFARPPSSVAAAIDCVIEELEHD